MKNVYLFLTFFLFLTMTSCESRLLGTQRIISEMEDHMVVFPEYLTSIYNGKTFENKTIASPSPILVFWFDSTECSSCRANHLYELEPLFEYAENSDELNIMVVFSPQSHECNLLIHILEKKKFDYPLYVDTDNSFFKFNDWIPAGNKFHTFLIDKSKTPIFIGNPMRNDKMWTLFEKRLRNLSN